MSKLYRFIEGEDIFRISKDDTAPMIEGILYQGDYVLFIAEEKIGKTILSQQLAMSLSSGIPFLGTFEINRPYNVWYMYNEVRDDQIKDRFIRMHKAVRGDVTRLKLVPFKFRFNTDIGSVQLAEMVELYKDNKPDVIIIDALYKAISGSIKDDNVVNDFNHVLGNFATSLGGCARVVVHHLNKPSKDEKGKFHKRTDKDSFGSAFILADVDHAFRLEKWGDDPNTKERILKCETQRSGEIADSTRLRLIEPDPLYYEVISFHSEQRATLLKKIGRCAGMTFNEILTCIDVGKTTGYKIVNDLVREGLLVKNTSKPKIYSLQQGLGLVE